MKYFGSLPSNLSFLKLLDTNIMPHISWMCKVYVLRCDNIISFDFTLGYSHYILFFIIDRHFITLRYVTQGTSTMYYLKWNAFTSFLRAVTSSNLIVCFYVCFPVYGIYKLSLKKQTFFKFILKIFQKYICQR